MQLISASYRIPVIVAVIIHLALIAALFIRHAGGGLNAFARPAQAVKIVEAKTVSSAELNQQIQQIEQQQHAQKRQQQAQVEKLKREAQTLERARIQEQQRIAKLKARQKQLELATKRQQEKAKAEEEAKVKAEEEAKAEKAKAEAQARAEKARAQKRLAQQRLKTLASMQKTLTQKLMQEQLASEQKTLSVEQDRALQGTLNRYTQKILGAISPNWIIPTGVASGAKATFLITLAPGGTVVDVKLLKSSGNVLLDRSCQVAIYKSSPLPVPKDPKLFDKLRELRLTLDPKDVIRL